MRKVIRNAPGFTISDRGIVEREDGFIIHINGIYSQVYNKNKKKYIKLNIYRTMLEYYGEDRTLVLFPKHPYHDYWMTLLGDNRVSCRISDKEKEKKKRFAQSVYYYYICTNSIKDTCTEFGISRQKMNTITKLITPTDRKILIKLYERYGRED